MNSGKLDEQALLVLQHMARYRLTFKEIIGYLYFGGSDPQKTLDDLRKQALIRSLSGFGGNRRAYVLLPKGAAALGASRRRADAARREARTLHYMILSYCFLCGRPRLRVERPELHEHLGVELPDKHRYAVEYSTKAKRICHLYVPGDRTAPPDVVDTTRSHFGLHRHLPSLMPWIGHKLFSLTVLVDNEDRRTELDRVLTQARDDDGRPLRKAVRVDVIRVPGLGDLEEALHVLA